LFDDLFRSELQTIFVTAASRRAPLSRDTERYEHDYAALARIDSIFTGDALL
jgi:hypothetical protein